MKTILFNADANERISGVFKNGYLVDAKPQPVSPPIFELEYRPTSQPDYDSILQYVSSVWVADTVLKTYTQVWIITDKILPTLADAKTQKIAELKSAVKELYQNIQWYLKMCRAQGTAIPAPVTNKIKVIKTRYDTAKTLINNYTTVSDVSHWKVPYDQIETIKTSLEEII